MINKVTTTTESYKAKEKITHRPQVISQPAKTKNFDSISTSTRVRLNDLKQVDTSYKTNNYSTNNRVDIIA